MPVDLIAKIQQKNDGDFKLLDASDLDAGDVDVILALVAGGRVVAGSDASAPAGEIVVQAKTTTGPPTHAATQATLCWNTVDKILYANSDGAMTWEDVSGGAAGGLPAHLSDTEDAHDASAVSLLDTANQYAATDVEAALAEVLDTEQAHQGESSGAHAASAVSLFDSAGVYAGTDVEAVLSEVGPLLRILPGANDAATDDGPVLQALHDALPALGGTIHLHGNRGAGLGHFIDSQVVISKPNVSILGVEGAQLIFGANAPDKALRWTGDNGKLIGVRSDAISMTAALGSAICIEGDGCLAEWVRHYATNTDATSTGRFMGDSADRLTFSNCLVDDAITEIRDCTNATIENHFVTHARTGIWVTDSGPVTIRSPWVLSTGTRMDGNIATSSWSGGVATFTFATAPGWAVGQKVVVTGVTGHTGYNFTFAKAISTVSPDGKTITLPITADPGGAGTGGMVSDGSIGKDAILVESGIGYPSHDITIDDPHILASREHGMYLSGALSAFTVRGGEITGQERVAIKASGGSGAATRAKDITISGTTIASGTPDGLGTFGHVGVYLARVDNVEVSNVTMRFDAIGELGCIGVYIGNCSTVSVSGVTCRNFRHGQAAVYITDAEPGDLTNISITDCVFENAYQYAYGSVFPTPSAPIWVVLSSSSTTLNGLYLDGNLITDTQSTKTAPYAIYLQDTTATTNHVYLGDNRGFGQASGYTYVGSGWNPEHLLTDTSNTWTDSNVFGAALSLASDVTVAGFTANVDDLLTVAPITVTLSKTISSTSSASSYTASGGYGAVGDTVLIFVMSTKGSAPDAPTITDSSLSGITHVSDTGTTSTTVRCSIYRATVAAVTSSTTTVSFAANQTACRAQVVELTGTESASQMIVQAASSSDITTSPTIPTDSVSNSNNVVLGMFGTGSGTVAVGSTWTQLSLLANVSLVEYKLAGHNPLAVASPGGPIILGLAVEVASYDPSTTYSVLRLSSDASRNLTGLAGGSDGRVAILQNVGSNPIVLKHDVTSVSANRFYCPGDTDFTLGVDESVFAVYDATVSRWRVIGTTRPDPTTALRTVDYLVGTASAELSGEIVVGTSPGGELGGSWATPTVDTSHSGSTHAATQAAAEATAVAADSAHVAAADPHTGYVLESFLDAKGDLITASADNTPSKLTVGADDTVLMADAAAIGGLKWVAPATPSTQAFGDAAAAGVDDTFTRGLHKHAMPTWLDLKLWSGG